MPRDLSIGISIIFSLVLFYFFNTRYYSIIFNTIQD